MTVGIFWIVVVGVVMLWAGMAISEAMSHREIRRQLNNKVGQFEYSGTQEMARRSYAIVTALLNHLGLRAVKDLQEWEIRKQEDHKARVEIELDTTQAKKELASLGTAIETIEKNMRNLAEEIKKAQRGKIR